MAMITKEQAIVGPTLPEQAITFMSYYPDYDIYDWVKVVEGVRQDSARTFVRYSGNGMKVLAIFPTKDGGVR